ncbi:hypothetical protein GCM10020255_014470 [Rhodococcus baikonurensis]
MPSPLRGDEITWSIYLNHGGAALDIALLTAREQPLLYIPGRTIYHVSVAYKATERPTC